MFKDVWYLPKEIVEAAQFIKDAHAISISGKTRRYRQSFPEPGKRAGKRSDFLIGPSQFFSYEQMIKAHSVYQEFDAFKQRKLILFTKKPLEGLFITNWHQTVPIGCYRI